MRGRWKVKEMSFTSTLPTAPSSPLSSFKIKVLDYQFCFNVSIIFRIKVVLCVSAQAVVAVAVLV